MKKILLLILLGTCSLFSQVTPTAVLEIYGDMWDGTTLTGHTGPDYTEYGTVFALGSGGPNGTAIMRWQGTPDSLGATNNTPVNAEEDNYVVFTVTQSDEIDYVSFVLDFRENDNSGYHLILSSERPSFQLGWYYGNESASNYFVNDQDTSTLWRIRTWVFQGDSGTAYVSGGEPRAAGGPGSWEPTALGGGTTHNKIGLLSSTSGDFNAAYMGIFAFDSSSTISTNWINMQGNILANYFNLPWTDLEVPYQITYPTDAGIYWLEGDTVNINWANSVGIDTSIVWLSINGGTSYDSIGYSIGTDSTFQWIVPGGIFSDECLIKISSPDSSFFSQSNNVFTIIPQTYLEIIDAAIDTTSHNIDVTLLTYAVDSVKIYFRESDQPWQYQGQFLIDNDSIFVVEDIPLNWTFYDSISIKVVEERDTTVYGLTSSVGSWAAIAPAGVCVSWGYAEEKGAIWVKDVSCGWSNITITWGVWEARLDDNGELYTTQTDYHNCPPDGTEGNPPGYVQADCLPCAYPYSCVSGQESDWFSTSSFTAYGRTYSISNDTLYQTDNLNHITYPIVDLSYWILNYKMSPAGYGWGVVGGTGNQRLVIINPEGADPRIYAIGLLPEPASALPLLYDIHTFQLSSVGGVPGGEGIRSHFRGIHPKAEKRN